MKSSELDSQVLAAIRDAFEHAWSEIPSSQITPEISDKMTEALVRSARRGERDVDRLAAIAKAAGLGEKPLLD